MFWATHPLMLIPLTVQLVPFVAPLSKMQYVQEGNYQTLGNKILTFLHSSDHILWYICNMYVLCFCKMPTKQLFICKVTMQQPITCGLGTIFFADLYTIKNCCFLVSTLTKGQRALSVKKNSFQDRNHSRLIEKFQKDPYGKFPIYVV